MKISQEDAILVLKEYPSKQYGARRLLSELPNKGWKLVDRVRHIAVEDLVLSQEDKPKRHQSWQVQLYNQIRLGWTSACLNDS